MAEGILFEFPLNERIRAFIRLEAMLNELSHFLKTETIWDLQSGIYALNRLLHFLERKDFRLETIQELERIQNNLKKLVDNQKVDQNNLQEAINSTEEHLVLFRSKNKSFDCQLKEDDLLNTVRLRIATANLTSAVDLPYFHAWLQQPHEIRYARFSEWVHSFDELKNTVAWILKSLRESAFFAKENAEAGSFQQTLNPQNQYSIIRLMLPANRVIFPEISGSKHRINIRFLELEQPNSRPKPIENNLEFKISVCS